MRIVEIQINKAILHVLDANATLPIFSQSEIDVSEPTTVKFIESHIKQFFTDPSTKAGTLSTDSYFDKDKIHNSFVDMSIRIANNLHDIIKKFPDIPGADLLIAIVGVENTEYVAVLKLNYRTAYTHFIDYEEDRTNNRIILQKTILPAENQKIDEGALINFSDNSCLIIEKKFLVDGERTNYFSEIFLQCKTELSKKESISIINSTAKEVARKYDNDEYEKTSLVKAAIYESLEDEGYVDLGRVADTAFSNSDSMKEDYIRQVQEAGVTNRIPFYGEAPEKHFDKYKIKTDNGIELNIPMELYRNRGIIEFINNPDGTVSILIKKISKIQNR